ncbi:MAG: GntR family transcriptional regulator [Actinomycetota bacterium]
MERVSLTDQVVAELREDILGGVLRPGTSLREVALSERFDVARSTIREAVKGLVAEGLLSHEHHRGVVVIEHTVADVEDLLGARMMIERTIGAAGPHTHDAAAAALEAMQEAVRAKDWRAAARADEEFHHGLVQALGSPRIAAFHSQMQAEMRLLLVTAEGREPETDKVAEHANLLELARAGDRDGYLAAARRHLQRSRPTLLAVAKQPADAPS